MATVIDELVVKLNLDSRGFQRASQEAQQATRKVSATSQDQAKLMEAAGNRVAEGFAKIKREAVALFALFLGANGLRQFVRDTTSAEVATGNLAANIGMSVQQLDAWGKASERLGGNAEATKQSLMGIGQAVQRLKTMGERSATTDMLAQLGVNMIDPKTGQPRDPGDIVRDLAAAVQKLPRPQAYSILSSMGLDPGTINLVLQGTAKLNSDLQDAFRIAMSWKDAKVGQDLYAQFVTLSQEVGKFARDLLTDLAPALTEIMKHMEGWLRLNREWLTHQIEEKVRQFATWIMSIDWQEIIQKAEDLWNWLDKVVQKFGGWETVIGAIIALKFGNWILGLISPITSLLSLMTTLNPALAAFLLTTGTILALKGDQGPLSEADKSKLQQRNQDETLEYLRTHPDYEPPGGWEKFGGRPAGATPTTKEQAARSKEAIDYFVSKGWTPAQAAGIVGNIQQESSFNPQAGAGTAHVGLAQWSAERQADIAQHFGKPVSQMSYQEQLAAMQWELTEGKYKDIGNQLRATKSAGTAAVVIDRGYEKPGNYESEDARRAANANARLAAYGGPDPSLIAGAKPRAVAASSTTNTTNNTHSVDTNINGPIQIHTAATDPDGIAKGIGASLRKYAIVGQANYGLA